MKHKDARQKNFSKGAMFFLICVVSLMLTGWGFGGNSTKANNLHVTNQTTAFQVVHAEIVGDRLNLTLRNVSEKTINGYSVALNRTLIQTDYTIGSFIIAPGQIEETTFPCNPNELSPEIEVQAVVFTDRTFNGTFTAAHAILHRREGIRVQSQAIQKLFDKVLESSDNQLPATVGQLASQVASLSEEGGREDRGRALRFGLRDAKADVLKMLRSVIEESGREKNFDLRQRLAQL